MIHNFLPLLGDMSKYMVAILLIRHVFHIEKKVVARGFAQRKKAVPNKRGNNLVTSFY